MNYFINGTGKPIFFIYIVSRPTFVTLISIQHDLGLHGKVNYKFIIL